MQERGPLTSRTSAWVAWHSCLGGHVGVGSGRLKQRWEGVGCDWPVPVCGNLLLYPRNSSSVEVLCHVMGRILLRVRDPVTWLCVESHIVGRPLFDFKHCSIKPSDRCCRHVYILVWERPCVFSPGVCRNVARLPVGLLPGWHGTVALVGVLESGQGEWSRGGRVLVVTGQYLSVE